MKILYFFLGSPPRWIATTFAFWAIVIWLAAQAFATCPEPDRTEVAMRCYNLEDRRLDNTSRVKQFRSCYRAALRRANLED